MTSHNKKKSLRKKIKDWTVAGIGAGIMAFSYNPEAKAENTEKTQVQNNINHIHAQDQRFTAAGDGILAKTFIQNLPLTPDTKTDLNSLFYTEKENPDNLKDAEKRDLEWRVIDSQQGLNNIKSYLNSQERELTGKEKAFKTHLNFLEDYTKRNSSDTESVNKLMKALEDGVVDVQADSLYNSEKNEWNIKKGTYMLIAKDKDESQSVPILTNVSTHFNKSPELKGKGVESYLMGDNLKNLDLDKMTLIRYDIGPEKGFFDDAGWSIIAQGTAGSDVYGAGIGAKYGPIAGALNIYSSSDETTKDVTSQPSERTGRYFSGTEKEVDKKGFGLGLEYHPKKVLSGSFLGAGIDYWNWTTETDENIHTSEGSVLARNTNSESNSDTSFNGYIGYSHPLNERWDLRGQVGYRTGVGKNETGKGFFGGVGLSYKFRKNEK